MDEILRKLVSFPTVSGDEYAMHQLLDYVADFVTQRGMHVEWFESNGFESIVATTQSGQKQPKVMLAAHADVVPADTDMFTMREADGKYIGRGVLDMKFAIAAYLQIVDDLKGDLADYDFGIMITGDEELGGTNGVAKLVDAGYIPQVCILPDGGDNWQLQTSSKGFMAFEIATAGKTAHGSRPWMGDNAIVKLLGILDEIATLFPKLPTPETNTIALCKITGGEAMNQIPNRAVMTIDIRTTDGTEHQRLHEAITSLCQERGVECTQISGGSPTESKLSDPFIAPFAQLVSQVTGVEQSGYAALGASDIRYYVPYGVPCISVYPKGGDLHSDNEWIDVQAFGQFKEITSAYLRQIARTSSMPAGHAADDQILTAAV